MIANFCKFTLMGNSFLSITFAPHKIIISQQKGKTHIPDGTGYQEKFYFSPGDTGFRVFQTKVGNVGVGICWDQWFPEAARSMALLGADVILYPTAIGSEPQDPSLNSSDHWQRVMQGHAAANVS